MVSLFSSLGGDKPTGPSLVEVMQKIIDSNERLSSGLNEIFAAAKSVGLFAGPNLVFSFKKRKPIREVALSEISSFFRVVDGYDSDVVKVDGKMAYHNIGLMYHNFSDLVQTGLSALELVENILKGFVVKSSVDKDFDSALNVVVKDLNALNIGKINGFDTMDSISSRSIFFRALQELFIALDSILTTQYGHVHVKDGFYSLKKEFWNYSALPVDVSNILIDKFGFSINDSDFSGFKLTLNLPWEELFLLRSEPNNASFERVKSLRLFLYGGVANGSSSFLKRSVSLAFSAVGAYVDFLNSFIAVNDYLLEIGEAIVVEYDEEKQVIFDDNITEDLLDSFKKFLSETEKIIKNKDKILGGVSKGEDFLKDLENFGYNKNELADQSIIELAKTLATYQKIILNYLSSKTDKIDATISDHEEIFSYAKSFLAFEPLFLNEIIKMHEKIKSELNAKSDPFSDVRPTK